MWWWIGAGVAFAAYPALRPWGAEPAAWVDPWWVPAHLLGAAGFVLLAVAARAERPERSPARRDTAVAAVLGAVLVLPYFGAEAFGLAALGGAVRGAGGSGIDQATAVAVSEAFRLGPWAAATFVAGLLAVAVAGVALLLAARRSGGGTVAGGVLTGIALLAYLPQFFAPPEVRVAHGVVLGIGCVLIGFTATHASAARPAA